MPNIRQLNAGAGGLQTETGAQNAFSDLARTQAITMSQAGAAIDRGISSVGVEGQKLVDKYAIQSEISKGSAALAVLNQNLNTQWNGLAKDNDPNDNTIAEKFQNGVLEKSLDDYVNSFETEKGQLWAQTQADNLRQHWYEKTTADTTTRAGIALKQNIDTTIDSLAATAGDPHSLDLALGLASDSIDALVQSSPGLSGVDAASATKTLLQDAREKITVAGLTAMAQANPVAFKADLEAGKFNRYTGAMPPGFDKTLSDYVETQIKTQAADDRAAVALKKKENEDNADAAATGLITSAFADDGSLRLPKDYFKTVTNKIAPMPGMISRPDSVRSLIAFGKTVQDDIAKGIDAKDVPEVYQDFRQRAFLPATDPRHLTLQEVMQARADHQLSDKSFTLYKEAVAPASQDPGKAADAKYFEAFLRGYKPAITNTTDLNPAADVQGDQRFYQFTVDMQDALDAGHVAGKSTAELLNPNSSSYILGPGARGLVPYLLASDIHDLKGFDLTKPVPPLAPIVPLLASPEEGQDAFLKGFYGTPDGGKPQLVLSTIAPRSANETPAEYLKRTGK